MDEFHKHLDECAHCRHNPFGLCNVGVKLLKKAVGVTAISVECSHDLGSAPATNLSGRGWCHKCQAWMHFRWQKLNAGGSVASPTNEGGVGGSNVTPEEAYDLRYAFEFNGTSQPITFEDVKTVHNYWKEDTDEPSFAWLVEMNDGRWAAVTAWHDYTGWDCQSGMTVRVFITREDAIRIGFTLNDRENLGLLLPGEEVQR